MYMGQPIVQRLAKFLAGERRKPVPSGPCFPGPGQRPKLGLPLASKKKVGWGALRPKGWAARHRSFAPYWVTREQRKKLPPTLSIGQMSPGRQAPRQVRLALACSRQKRRASPSGRPSCQQVGLGRNKFCGALLASPIISGGSQASRCKKAPAGSSRVTQSVAQRYALPRSA